MPYRIYHNDYKIPKDIRNIRQLKRDAFSYDFDKYLEYIEIENEMFQKWLIRIKKLNSLL
ncbi:hypothetical protein M0Q50_03385 [bacterium]|jgi:hypothetical protein|nr:hypothetical protein [bacterium]